MTASRAANAPAWSEGNPLMHPLACSISRAWSASTGTVIAEAGNATDTIERIFGTALIGVNIADFDRAMISVTPQNSRSVVSIGNDTATISGVVQRGLARHNVQIASLAMG
jgi:hypothetical protein